MSTWRAMPWAVRTFVLLQVASFVVVWSNLIRDLILEASYPAIAHSGFTVMGVTTTASGVQVVEKVAAAALYGVLVYRVAWLRATSARIALVALFVIECLRTGAGIATGLSLFHAYYTQLLLSLNYLSFLAALTLEGMSYPFIFSRSARRWFERHDLAEKAFE